MISVDISNIWCSVSLPELLSTEKNIFDAHMQLTGEHRQNGWLSWVSTSDEARRTWVVPVQDAVDRIRINSEILVVVGGGLSAAAAQAAIRLMPRVAPMRLLFLGEDYSSDKWQRAVQMLENAEFSVLVAAPTGNETAPLITLRALRWIMEKRYGDRTKDRIFVSAGSPRSALIRLAEALGYQVLPAPESVGAGCSALNPAALMIMTAAGMSPSLIFSGAAEMAAECDARSFDNPAWLYAGARTALAQQGLRAETLCTTTPDAESLGTWWKGVTAAACCKDGQSFFLNHMRLPGDFFSCGDAILQPGQFVSLLRMPLRSRKVTVEMDWKDLDGLNGLVGQDLTFVEGKTLDAVADAMTEQEVPFVTLECSEEMTDDKIGELLYFLEFSAGLTAHAKGVSPASHRVVADILENLDKNLGRKTSNV